MQTTTTAPGDKTQRLRGDLDRSHRRGPLQRTLLAARIAQWEEAVNAQFDAA